MPRTTTMAAEVLGEVLACRAVPGRPADLEGDDLVFIRAAAGRVSIPIPASRSCGSTTGGVRGMRGLWPCGPVSMPPDSAVQQRRSPVGGQAPPEHEPPDARIVFTWGWRLQPSAAAAEGPAEVGPNGPYRGLRKVAASARRPADTRRVSPNWQRRQCAGQVRRFDREEAMRIQTPPCLVAGPPTAAASSRSVG
jgi:hypothetical protein